MEDYSGTSMAANKHLVAEPHQQTPSQFMNRPDVAVHARIYPKGEAGLPTHITSDMDEGLHVGTEQAAKERINNMLPNVSRLPRNKRENGFETAAHYGTVDPKHMENTPHNLAEDEGVFSDANTRPKGIYYKNDAEDQGSISAMIPGGNRSVEGPSRMSTDTPGFKTWRAHVTDALNDPSKAHTVPHHVRAIYEASGGAGGTHATYPVDLQPRKSRLVSSDQTPQMALAPFSDTQQPFGLKEDWRSPNDPYDANLRGESATYGNPDQVYNESYARMISEKMQDKGHRVPNALKRAAGGYDDTKKIYR